MEQRSTDDVPLSEFDDKSGLDVDGSIQSNPDYQRAMRLAAVEDPPEEPFISKYEAREILESLQDTTDSPSAKAVIRAAIGCNLIETEQYSEGGAMVMEVLETLQLDYTVNYIEIFQCLISLGIVWIQRGDHVQSLKFLTQAEQHYQVILSARSGGRVGEGPELILEALYTQTCFYLAQIYTKQNETVKAAFYCHRTLNRQLTLRSTTLQFDPVEWSSNCIKLSAFYISSGRLSQARYCLDAAEAINSCIEKNGPRDSVSADFHCAAAEIFASQLHMSAKLLSNASLNGEIDVSIDQFESLPDLPKAEFGFVRKFCEAQQVFRCGYDAYQLALKFYQLDGFVTDYVALLQKCCQLMKDFSTFSSDPAFICKLLKRSIDLAEPVLDQLNPKIYTDYVRQFSYDVAEWYSEMSALKEQQYSSKGVMDATRSKKINYLIWKAIHRFEALSKLCSSNERSAVTDEKFLINNGSNVDVVHLKTFLSARFQIARLYSRIIPANRSSQVSFLKQSLGEYESIVALCRIRQNQQSNLDSISQFCQELAISVEMCSLLPLKISKISSGAG